VKHITGALTVTVRYDVPNHHYLANTYMDVTELLESLVDHAVGNGLLTGDTELTVASWDSKVDIYGADNRDTEEVKL